MKLMLCLFIVLTSVIAVPFQFHVPHRRIECMWEQMKAGESATASVFVLEGSSLKAVLILEGPFANSGIESTVSLMEAEQKYELERHHRTGDNGFMEVVDFEHLQLPPLDLNEVENMEEVEEYDDDMLEEGEDMETALKRIEKRRERNKAIRLKVQEARKRMHQRMLDHAKENAYVVKSEGEPYQRTIHATTDGWYRSCVRADFNNILVEFEFRTSRQQGGIDPDTNHVYTFETWKLIEEERFENENQEIKDQSIKEEDFIPTRNAVRDLKRSVGQITSIQQSLIHRMILHAEVGEHAHDKLTQTSIIMTLLFILSTVFQFYIIHRWFTKSTAPLLGR